MALKLLIVDDNADCRQFIHCLLSRAGYEVVEATDGVEGFDLILADRPQIIITDWHMPRLDGLDLIRRVRQANLDWYPYILLLTANDDVQLGLDTGADEFLSKPIEENTLLPRVRAAERIVALQQRLNERNLELNRANRRLAQLATTDSLSGLLNRRAFFTHAEQEWCHCQRYNLPLSCLMLDIDHFKKINDSYGHTVGDAVIVALAGLLQTRLRETDFVSRYGGEEFCILLTNTELERARTAAEGLCRSVRQVTVEDYAVCFSVSIGVADRTPDLANERALINRADQALMTAKRSGRDRVLCYGEQPVVTHDWSV